MNAAALDVLAWSAAAPAPNPKSRRMFDGPHLHLLVNHAPILGAYFAVALLAASLVTAAATGDVLRRTACFVLVGVALAAVTSNLSGGGAAGGVRGLPGVTRAAIHAHAQAADPAWISAAVVGVLALGALVRWRRTPVPRGATVAALALSLGVTGLMTYVGLLGGQIRHTEVRPGATPADAARVEPAPPRGGALGAPAPADPDHDGH